MMAQSIAYFASASLIAEREREREGIVCVLVWSVAFHLLIHTCVYARAPKRVKCSEVCACAVKCIASEKGERETKVSGDRRSENKQPKQ